MNLSSCISVNESEKINKEEQSTHVQCALPISDTSQYPYKYSEHTPLKININSVNSIMSNYKIIDISQLDTILPNFINNYSPNYVIVINQASKSSNHIYQKIINLVEQTIQRNKHVKSKSLFNKKYHELSILNKDVIDNMFPINIIKTSRD